MTSRLGAVTGGIRPPGVYRWLSRAHIESVRRELHVAGWALYPLEGRGIVGATQLFDRSAKAMAFPAWFGHNWDALGDCLNDLGWLPGLGHIVLWNQYGVLGRADPKSWRMAYYVMSTAIETRQIAGARPLFVLLRGAGPIEQPEADVPIPPV